MKKYKVTLTCDEAQELTELTRKGKRSARILKNALILLNVDQGAHGPGHPDQQVADVLQVSVRTIENIRKRFVEEGFETCVYGTSRQRGLPAQDGRGRRGPSDCPELQYPSRGPQPVVPAAVADKMVELQYVDSVSHETVRRVLKKTS